jgi:hypothetical protein
MDARQFDQIARTLRSGTDRRRVLGVLVGSLAAILGAQRATMAAECAKPGQKPKDHKPCCVGDPVDGRCPAESAPLLGRCILAGRCECNDGGKVCTSVLCTGSEAGKCAEDGTPCTCKIGPV